MLGDTLAVLRVAAGKQFIVLHIPVPHAPYVFAADGSFRTPAGTDEVAGYLGQLACMDRLIGEAVAALQAPGTFDRAMIVMTSDHSWQYEHDAAILDLPDSPRHVPLIVKMPRQTAPQVVDERVQTDKLGVMFEAVFRGRK